MFTLFCNLKFMGFQNELVILPYYHDVQIELSRHMNSQLLTILSETFLYINLVKQIYYVSNLNKTHFSDSSSIMSRTHGSSRRRPQRRRRRQPLAMSRTSSFSSITDSTMSLNIITVTLNMDTVNFLGISIVGQSNKGGDGGIYVGSIMKG